MIMEKTPKLGDVSRLPLFDPKLNSAIEQNKKRIVEKIHEERVEELEEREKIETWEVENTPEHGRKYVEETRREKKEEEELKKKSAEYNLQ